MTSWSIPLTNQTLSLPFTLGGGQSFRWKEVARGEWIGVLKKNVLLFKQFPDHTECTVAASLEPNLDKTKEDVENFLRVDTDLEDLYKYWSKRDEYFNSVETRISGIRVLRQDPVETVFSFICSSNNNIPRIATMVNKLCKHYGEPIGQVEGEMYYSFPSVKSLAADKVEEELRTMGFGYRSKYIHQSAQVLVDRGDEWLTALRDSCDYSTARDALMSLPGVGPKVADCVCLMALDKLEAVPVDTHVWQVAKRHYGFSSCGKESKTMSSKLYMEIGKLYIYCCLVTASGHLVSLHATGDHFRSIFGDLAGWAQTVS